MQCGFHAWKNTFRLKVNLLNVIIIIIYVYSIIYAQIKANFQRDLNCAMGVACLS